MKHLLILIASAAVALAYEPILVNYHENVGIPLAARIKQAELAMDFDGSRIVGGSVSPLGAHPYLAGLLIILPTGRDSVCGATLVSNTRFLTAAHCWIDGGNVLTARQATVVLGSERLYSGGTRIITRTVTTHANYLSGVARNDIAIGTITWVSYTDVIQPAALPSGSLLNENFAGMWAQASGFGRTADASWGAININSIQHQVMLQVMNNAACAAVFGSLVVIDSTLCTSGGGGVGTCSGDSGGPLTINIGGKPTLIGVVSFGALAGCQIGYPSGYARVTAFDSWIRTRM